MKIAESSSVGYKTLWEKEKLLVTSNFSFSYCVFKGHAMQTGKNQGLFGRGLRESFDPNQKIRQRRTHISVLDVNCLIGMLDEFSSLLLKTFHISSLIGNIMWYVLRGSVVKCLTCNPGVLGSSRTGSSGFFFRGSVLGQDTSESSLVMVKPRRDMNYVSCHRDMTEILLKMA